MKKILLSLFTLATLSAFAQKDLVVTMDSPAVNQNIDSGAVFNIKYSLKNAGTTDIAITDSIALGVVINNQVVSALLVNHGGIAAGVTKSGSISSYKLNFSTGLNGANFCLLATLRYSGNLDSNLNNNVACATVNLRVHSGINELLSSLPVSIYPVPAVDVLNLDYNYTKESSLVIYDITGKKMETINVNSGSARVDVSAYKQGIYLYEIYSSENAKLKSGKFTVSH